MKRRGMQALLGGLLAVGFGFEAYAELKQNPYQVIIERNPFGLREPPPPPPPPTNEPPPPPPLDIKLTGISTLLGPAKVFLEFTDPQTKKVDRPSAMLEGDTHKNVTILAIDSENNRVKVKTPDTETWLDFDKHGIKPTATAAAAPVPAPGAVGKPPVPGVPPVPGATTPTPAGAAPGPSRGGLSGGGAVTFTPPAAGVPVSTAAGLPPRPLRTDAGGAGLIGGVGGTVGTAAPTPAPSGTTPALTAEQAQQIIEARRIQLQQQGNPMQSILPPTPLGRQLQNTPPAPGQ